MNDPQKPEKEDTESFGLGKIVILTLVLTFGWMMAKDKIIPYFSEHSDLGVRVSQKKIDVHPEVLNLQESFATVAESLKPAVVNISTIQLEKYQANPYEFFFMNPDDLFNQFFNAPGQGQTRPQGRSYQRKIPGTGSGVIIDPKGYILTNEHVVRDADEIKVTLANDPDKRYDGKVIGRDERTDLAVVKIKSSKKLPFAKLGDSKSLRVGDWAIAIGSPFGLEQTVTVGIISASRQNVSLENKYYKDLIQTDAAINPGNSGGPLLNIRGEVIGINTAIYTPSGGFAGIGFAIPINQAKAIIPQLREKGKVVRGWIGVILGDKINEATASVFGVKNKEGSMIREVLEGFPADKAGLRRGDVIVEFAGTNIKNNFDLQSAVSSTPPGKTVTVKIIRNKKKISLKLKTTEAPSSLGELRRKETPIEDEQDSSEDTSWLGASVINMTDSIRKRYNIPKSEKGVIVSSVEPDSKGEEIGLRVGDLIRSINQKGISNISTFKKVTSGINTNSGVVFDISRRGEPQYISYMGPEK